MDMCACACFCVCQTAQCWTYAAGSEMTASCWSVWTERLHNWFLYIYFFNGTHGRFLTGVCVKCLCVCVCTWIQAVHAKTCREKAFWDLSARRAISYGSILQLPKKLQVVFFFAGCSVVECSFLRKDVDTLSNPLTTSPTHCWLTTCCTYPALFPGRPKWSIK